MASKETKPEETPARPAAGVIGVGASAGGLAAVESFLAALPAAFPWPVLVAQHMDPHARSHFVDLVARHSALRVAEAKAGERIEPGVVLICPPAAEMSVTRDLTIHLDPVTAGRPHRIDRLFKSLADTIGPRSVAVVLSGTGTDGVEGVLAVKRRGGMVFAESEASAKHPGMPNAAVQAGAVDMVGSAQEIPGFLAKLVEGTLQLPSAAEQDAFKKILALVKKRQGTALDQYREPTLRRRIGRRMAALQVPTMVDYLAHLDREPKEADELFQTILINVTEFFRDPETWEEFARRIVPALVARLDEVSEVRVWAAGCASGEEAYSIAMLFAEALPDPADWNRVRIFATDIDPNALAEARLGRYEAARVGNVPPERLNRFFERAGALYEIAKPLRRMVVFGLHDLTRDPPIGRLDAVVCRNVLIYFDTPLQRRALVLFNYALRAGGYLFLGKSEDIPRDVPGFEPVERKSRIFQRRATAPPPLPRLGERIATDEQRAVDAATHEELQPGGSRLPALVLEAANLVVLVADKDGKIRYANRFGRDFLLAGTDRLEERKLTDLLRTPDAAVLTAIENATKAPQRVRLGPHAFLVRGKRVILDLVVEGFADANGAVMALVIGQDATAREEAQEALQERARQLQEAAEAVQTSNANLQSANEELVTANEELQSSNEELATLNEELQSSNEELETVNEELQSTNEELGAVNAELTSTGAEADRLHVSLDALAAVTSDAIVVCDVDEVVTLWGGRAGALLGLRADEAVGRNVYSVPLQLDLDVLRRSMAKARETGGVIETPAVALRNARGEERWVSLAITALRTSQRNDDGWVLAFRDRTEERGRAKAVADAEARYRALLQGTKEAILQVESDGRVTHATPAAQEILGLDPAKGAKLWDLTNDKDAILRLKGALADLTEERAEGKPERHVLSVKLRNDRIVSFDFIAVPTAGAPPLLLLHTG